MLLVIACVNISSLLMVRSESRRREIAVRGALGASRPRLIRQFVTEGLVLVVAGTALGLAFASILVRILLGLITKDVMSYAPYLSGLGLDPRCLAFAAALALLALVLFALAPMLRLAGRNSMREGLSEGGRTAAGNVWRRLGSNLVVVELAMAVVLLAAAVLLGKSFHHLLHVELGFVPDHLATAADSGAAELLQRRADCGSHAASSGPHRQFARRGVCRDHQPNAGKFQWQHDLDPICGQALSWRAQ